jgi:hypothetical protein
MRGRPDVVARERAISANGTSARAASSTTA